MRKRSGALHSTNQEEYLKLAVEQQKQFSDIYTLQQKCMSETFDPYSEENINKRKKKPIYDLRPYIDLQGSDQIREQNSYDQSIYQDLDYSSTSSIIQNGDESQEYNESKQINTKVVNIMLLTEFEEQFIPEIYKLDSFNPTEDCYRTCKNKMLDLVIETEQIDASQQVVYKLWMHNISSSRQSSFHNQIIEEIHYSRCSQFMFLYEEGNSKSEKEINLSYEKTKKIKCDNFQATFIGVVSSNSTSQTPQSLQQKQNQADLNSDDSSFSIKTSQNVKHVVVNSNKLTSCIRNLCQFKERKILSCSSSSPSTTTITTSTTTTSTPTSLSVKRSRQNKTNSTALSTYHHLIINNQKQLLNQYSDENLQINTISVNE